MFTERLVWPPDFCVHHIFLYCVGCHSLSPGLACVAPRLAESAESDKTINGVDYTPSGFVGFADILD